MTTVATMRTVETDTAAIACLDRVSADGRPVVLIHGSRYEVRACDEATPILAAAGASGLYPDVRGYGQTRFLSDETMRSGQQAVPGRDIIGCSAVSSSSAPWSKLRLGWPHVPRSEGTSG